MILSLKGKVARRRNKELNSLKQKLPFRQFFAILYFIMSWASRRKSIYTLVFLSIVLIVVFFITFSVVHKPASCFDGIQNQGEQGIDCGGPCSLLCRANYVNPTVLWVRWAKIQSSATYTILAYAENPNIGVGAFNVPYSFKIYDANNILLYNSPVSYASIPANNNFVVFQSGIDIHDKVPARIDFAFSNGIVWQKVPNLEQGITVLSKTLLNADTAPKILATIQNTTANTLANIQSVAIVYDADGNAIAFSKTVTDALASGANADIAFTWPAPFSGQEYKIEIISQVLPQQ